MPEVSRLVGLQPPKTFMGFRYVISPLSEETKMMCNDKNFHEFLPIGCSLRMALDRCSPQHAHEKNQCLVAKATQDVPTIANTWRVQKMLGSKFRGPEDWLKSGP